jgi:thymidylate synthase (FAD)
MEKLNMSVKLIRHTPEPFKTCWLACRMCYSPDSFDNLEKKFDEYKKNNNMAEPEKLLRYVIDSGHHSIIEHVSFTFLIEHVSRALLAQITRHRLASFSVQSQRYVKNDKLDYIVPHTISKNKDALQKYKKFMQQSHELYKEFLDLGFASEDARFVLPTASPTNIMVTMNARELLHFFTLRCCSRSQWEIREVAIKMLNEVKAIAPEIFKRGGPACVRGKCPEGKSCGKPWGEK